MLSTIRDVLPMIQTLIDSNGVESTWHALLRARVTQSGEIFSYILTQPELHDTHIILEDILFGLSIGEISVLYEYSLAYNNRKKRKDEGQYFTPDDVARFMANHARTFPNTAVWIDPCSGVGNLSYWLIREQADPEQFLLTQLYLVDRDPIALLIARVLFTLYFQRDDKHLFIKIADRFLERDFLKTHDLPICDVAILNPPYVSGVLDENFATANARNTYAYFLEKVATLCSKGYIAITPQTFTNGQRFSPLREMLINCHSALDVYCFDNVPDNIFSGFKFGSDNTNKANSTRAAILVARNAQEKCHRITPLLRWRSHERAAMFAAAPSFLTATPFTNALFPKITKELAPLYAMATSFQKTLGSIVASGKTPYALYVPSTPRYFISANKAQVARTSSKTLYFNSSGDRDYAYIVLNSSYMYWWWRVCDGGMTITEKTLLELPIPDDGAMLNRRLVANLEQSEKTSKVVKLNAGKVIENIKHSPELVHSLTMSLFPQYANHLRATHSNSHMSNAAQQMRLAY